MGFVVEGEKDPVKLPMIEEGQTYIVDMNGNTAKRIGSDSEDENHPIRDPAFFTKKSLR